MLLCLWSIPASAMVQEWSFGNGQNTISNSATTYVYTHTHDRTGNTATESSTYRMISVAGTISNMNINVSAAPGNAKSFLVTLRLNAADTALTCTVTGAATTTCADTTHSVSVVPGDLVDLTVVPSGTPSAGTFTGTMRFDSTASSTISTYAYNINGGTLNGSSTRYLPIAGTNFNVTPDTEVKGQQIIAASGSMKSLYIQTSAAPGAAKSYAFTVRKNGADTALTCTISGASATTCNDTTHTISVAAGDLLVLAAVPTGTPTGVSVWSGWSFDSSVAGVFMYIGTSTSATVSASVDNYFPFNGSIGGVSSTNTTNAVRARLIDPHYFKSFYAHVFTAPDNGGGTQAYQMSLYDTTAAAATVATCQISEASTDCNYTGSLALNASSQFTYSVSPSGTPTVAGVAASVAMTLTAPIASVIKNATIKNATIKGY